jgi:hypothetical protein
VRDSFSYRLVPRIRFNYDENGNDLLDDYGDGDELLWMLEGLRMHIVDAGVGASSRTHVYGFVGGGMASRGLVAWPGHVAYGVSTDRYYQRTLAHLLGHNLGLCDAGFDTIGVPGWDVSSRLVMNPSGNDVDSTVKAPSLFDFMTPERPTSQAWVSPDTHSELLQAMEECSPETEERVLGITGRMRSLGDALEKMAIVEPPGAMHSSTTDDPEGEFAALITDDIGGVITLHFTPQVLGERERPSALWPVQLDRAVSF